MSGNVGIRVSVLNTSVLCWKPCITYGFVGNSGFMGKPISHNRTCHPKYSELKVILQHSMFK